MVVTIKNLTANVVCMSKKAEVLSFKLLMQSGNRENTTTHNAFWKRNVLLCDSMLLFDLGHYGTGENASK